MKVDALLLPAAQKYVAVCSHAFSRIMESEPFLVLSLLRSPVKFKCSINGTSTLSSFNSVYPYPISFRALSPGEYWYHSITL